MRKKTRHPTKQSLQVRNAVRTYYKDLGAHGVRDILRKKGIRRSISTIYSAASEEDVKKRDPKEAKIIELVIRKIYPDKGAEGVMGALKEKNINRTKRTIGMLAHNFRVKKKRVYIASPQMRTIQDAIKKLYADERAEGVQKYLKEHHGIERTIGRIKKIANEMHEYVKQRRTRAGEKSSKTWWLHLPAERKKEFQEKFLADFRSNCRDPRNANEALMKRWPEAINKTGLRNAARALGETRNRLQIANEYKTASQVEEEIEHRTNALIQSGYLKNQGADGLYEEIKREFAKEILETHVTLEREKFFAMLDRLVWTEGKQGRLTILNEYMESGLSPEEFEKDDPLIPLKMVKEKIQEERGVTNRLRRIKFETGLLRGVGRYASPEELRSGDDFKFPRSDFHNPFPVFSGNTGSVLLLNGANVGLKYIPSIKGNPRVNALHMAREDGDEAVIITNTIDLYTKKAAGASRVLAAIWSGMNVDPALFPDSYQKEVLEILKNKNKPDDAVIYQKPRESLHNTMSGWNKITWEPVSKKSKEVRPVFPKNIYVVFGLREHQFAAVMAYWHVHYLTKVKQGQIKAKLKAAYSLLARAEKGNADMPVDLEERIMSLVDLDERTIISDVMDEYWQLYYQRAVGYLAKKFEEVLPNCKVIGMSTTHIKIGSETMTIQIPTDARVTDTTLSQYTHAYGPKVLREEMSRFVAICHPYGLGPRGTAREVDARGKRDHALIWTAPACVEEAYLRQQQKRVPGREHPIAQKIWNEISTPGVLRVRLINGALMPEDISIEALNRYAGRRAA